MYRVFKDFEISSGHFVRDHPGECRRLHGHNYRVRVWVEAERLDAIGMVVDFARVKQAQEEVLGRLDHRVLNDLEPFDRVNPTAENIAEHVWRGCSERLDDDRVRVSRVEVFESDRSGAVFEPRRR